MPRGVVGARWNIAEIERYLEDRKSELNRLLRQRSGLQKKLDGLDRQIARIEGGGGAGRRGGGGGGRARNEHSLADVIESVLRGAGQPVSIGDIIEGVERSGYRSGSANFRSVVNQALIKDKRFVSASRGVYTVKGGAAGAKKERPKDKSEE